MRSQRPSASDTSSPKPSLPESRRREGSATEGNKVAVVGTASMTPQVAQSDLGIAVGAGTDVAMEAAGVVLVRSNLLDVVAALDISRVTFRRIRINLFFSLAYNCLGVPIAAGALYPLIHAITAGGGRFGHGVVVSIRCDELAIAEVLSTTDRSHRSEVFEPASAVLIEMNRL